MDESDKTCPRCGWTNAHALDCSILRRFAAGVAASIKKNPKGPEITEADREKARELLPQVGAFDFEENVEILARALAEERDRVIREELGRDR